MSIPLAGTSILRLVLPHSEIGVVFFAFSTTWGSKPGEHFAIQSTFFDYRPEMDQVVLRKGCFRLLPTRH